MLKTLSLVLALIFITTPSPSAAQQVDNDELRQLKIKVDTLEHAVYKNGKKAPSSAHTLHDNANLLTRINALEETLQNLTGRIEQLEHKANSSKLMVQKPAETDPAEANDEYQKALSLVYANKYNEADIALRRFIGAHPKHSLLGNAHYWLGETQYARQQYEQASLTFLKAYELFPNGNKTHDNLLKLGMALSQIGKKNEACITFGKLLDSMPQITISIKARAREEFSKLNCK